jgi:hypothetical protein
MQHISWSFGGIERGRGFWGDLLTGWLEVRIEPLAAKVPEELPLALLKPLAVICIPRDAP